MPDLVWEDPPEPGSGKAASNKYAPIAAELRTQPGKWARVGVYNAVSKASTITNAVRTGAAGFSPKGAFQATSRTIKGGMQGQKVIHLYVRYVGGEDL